jgi:XTP/dITP diphosphohydrolase
MTLAIGPRPTRLVIATHNPGKLVEIQALLEPYGCTCLSAGALGLPEPEETELTFTGNALLKARAACAGADLPALADDSGLAVATLNGAPGIYSARWAGATKDFGIAMARVQAELGDAPDRTATFVCALALVWPSGEELVTEGIIDGTITWPPRGDRGFGYDPIFVPVGDSRSFGEFDPEEKHRVSHRAVAFRQLVDRLFA